MTRSLFSNTASTVSCRPAPLSLGLSRSSLGFPPVINHIPSLLFICCTSSMTKRAAGQSPAPAPTAPRSNRKRRSTPGGGEFDLPHQEQQGPSGTASTRAAASSAAHDHPAPHEQLPTPAKKTPQRRPPAGSRKRAHDQVHLYVLMDIRWSTGGSR